MVMIKYPISAHFLHLSTLFLTFSDYFKTILFDKIASPPGPQWGGEREGGLDPIKIDHEIYEQPLTKKTVN